MKQGRKGVQYNIKLSTSPSVGMHAVGNRNRWLEELLCSGDHDWDISRMEGRNEEKYYGKSPLLFTGLNLGVVTGLQICTIPYFGGDYARGKPPTYRGNKKPFGYRCKLWQQWDPDDGPWKLPLPTSLGTEETRGTKPAKNSFASPDVRLSWCLYYRLPFWLLRRHIEWHSHVYQIFLAASRRIRSLTLAETPAHSRWSIAGRSPEIVCYGRLCRSKALSHVD